MTPRVAFCTLGCKVNQYETQAIAENFVELGYSLCNFSEKADVYIINTCTVTSESDKKSRQMIRKARKNGGSDAIVIAIGCFSQAQKDSLSQITELDAAFGNSDKSVVADYANSLLQKTYKNSFENNVKSIDECKMYDDMSISHSERTRAVVKIVDGCENKCSYCIIPSVRGKVRSRDKDKIISELVTLADAGYKEVVLTGIETAAYGKDKKDLSLVDLLNSADKVSGIERIRLGSLEPTVIKNDFISTLKKSNHLVPHLHLSLQSGCDSILASMRRKYNTTMFYNAISKLRAEITDITFTTDIIVGFPGETDEMFEETCGFVKKCKFLYVHIFPYSKRDSTDAAVMPNQIESSVKKKRVSLLKETMLEVRKDVLQSFDGKNATVIFEEYENGYFVGHTQHYIDVKYKSEYNEQLIGKITDCRLIFDETTSEHMLCEIIKE